MGFCPTSFDNLILSPKRKPCVLKFLNFLLNSYTNSKSSVKNLLSFLEFLVIQKIQISFLDVKESFLDVKEMFLEVKEMFLEVKEEFLEVKEMFLDEKKHSLDVKECFFMVLSV